MATYVAVTSDDAIERVVHDVKRVKIKSDTIRLIGRKDVVLATFAAAHVRAVWREVGTPVPDDSRRYRLTFSQGSSIVVDGVVDVSSETNDFGGTTFHVLEGDDDDLPVAVAGNRVEQIRHEQVATTPHLRPSISLASALVHDPDSRLTLVALTTGTMDEPNVISCRRRADGSWTTWETVGDAHLSGVAAVPEITGGTSILGYEDEGPTRKNVRGIMRGDPHADWPPTWRAADGVLTSLAAAIDGSGRHHLIGANLTYRSDLMFSTSARHPLTGDDFLNGWRNDNWHKATSFGMFVQPNQRHVVVSVDSTTAAGDNTTISTGPDSWAHSAQDVRLTTVAVVGHSDGRGHIFGVDADAPWRSRLHECVQVRPNGPWGPWTQTDINLSTVTAAVEPDGRIHVIGLTNEAEAELVHRHEATPGGAWTPWRVISNG